MDDKKNIVNRHDTHIDPNTLNKLLKNSNDMQDLLKWHVVWDNKISIWLGLLIKCFPVIRNYLILAISGVYGVHEVLHGTLLDNILEFVINNSTDRVIVMAVCFTIICIFYIKRKYK